MKPTQPKNLISGASSRSIRFALQLAALSSAALSTQAYADLISLTTNDPAGSNSFTTAGKWSNAAAPTADNDYSDGGFTIRTPTTAGDFTFAGKSLSLDVGDTSRLLGKGAGSNTTQTITVPNLILNGGRLDQAGGFSTTGVLFVVKGAINVTAPSMLGAIGANANGTTNFEVMEIAANISGSELLSVGGSINGGDDHGVVRLSAANSYTGEIDILSPTNGGTISSTTNRLLQLSNPDALRNATLGLFTLVPDGLSFAASANTASFRVGALAGSAKQTLSDTAGNPVTLEVGGTGLDSFFFGGLTGNGNLVKAGAGTVNIQGQALTFSGSVTIQQGVLSLGADALLNNNSTITIASGAKLDLSYEDTDVVAGLTLGGVAKPDGIYDSSNSGGYITGTGKIRVNTGAPLPENVKLLANDATGATSFNTAGNWSNAAAPSAINSYFTQAFTLRTPTVADSFTFPGTVLSVDPGGRLLGKGAGTANAIQTITVPNLVLNGGRIEQAAAAIAGVVMNLNGNISVVQDSSIGALGPGTANAANFETLDIAAKISGSAQLHVAGTANGNANSGTVRLSGENDFSGIISVEQPSAISSQTNRLLQLNHLSALKNATLTLATTTTNGVSFASAANTGAFKLGGLSGATNQTLTDTTGAGVQLDIGGSNATSTYDGVLDGTGSIIKSGTGTLTLTGLNVYTGATTVNGGVLALSQASLDDASTVSISSTGVLNLTHTQTDVVGKLVLNGVAQAAGVYDANNSGGRITGTGKIQVVSGGTTSGFATFMNQFNGLSQADKAVTADPDGDGLSNLLEYALDGLDPTKADRIPTIDAQGTLSFTKRAAAVTGGDVTYSIETSTTLAADSWTKVTPTVDNATTISYTLPAGQPRTFMRLRVDSAQ